MARPAWRLGHPRGAPWLARSVLLLSVSADVQADVCDADGLVGFPGSRQPGEDLMLAAWRGDPEPAALGAAEPVFGIDRPSWRLVDLEHAGRKFESPLVAGGGAGRERQLDRLAGDAVDVEFLGRRRRVHGAIVQAVRAWLRLRLRCGRRVGQRYSPFTATPADEMGGDL